MLKDAMKSQNAEYFRRLGDMENNQKEIAAKLNEAVDILRESSDRERRFQEDVLDLFVRYTQQLT